ncbi:hypothetical protein PCL_03883 [Purpureocillium lilacinum]|uniref:Uncharacterized protein n=1 Tax=Purpureocillium lilacinum TaxID=33203 RepID=A0A2U3EQB2_PURLI|nr:hypothetical protein PCL_03883 [Purpureocillium lilacinum]
MAPDLSAVARRLTSFSQMPSPVARGPEMMLGSVARHGPSFSNHMAWPPTLPRSMLASPAQRHLHLQAQPPRPWLDAETARHCPSQPPCQILPSTWPSRAASLMPSVSDHQPPHQARPVLPDALSTGGCTPRLVQEPLLPPSPFPAPTARLLLSYPEAVLAAGALPRLPRGRLSPSSRGRRHTGARSREAVRSVCTTFGSAGRTTQHALDTQACHGTCRRPRRNLDTLPRMRLRFCPLLPQMAKGSAAP